MRRAGGLVLILLASVLTLRADAAEKHMVYAKKTVFVGPHRSKDVTVDCPPGSEAIGGGTSGSSNKLVTQASTGGFTGWRGTIFNPTRERQSMAVVADCVKDDTLPAATNLAATATAAGLAAHTAQAYSLSCGAGRIMTGGGAAIATPPSDRRARILFMGPSDGADGDNIANDGFTAAIVNDTDNLVSIQVQSLCIDPVATIDTKSVDVTVKAGRNTSGKVHCDAGDQPTGGGVTFTTADPDGALRSTKPTGLRSSPPGNGWFATMNPGLTVAQMTVIARCIAP